MKCFQKIGKSCAIMQNIWPEFLRNNVHYTSMIVVVLQCFLDGSFITLVYYLLMFYWSVCFKSRCCQFGKKGLCGMGTQILPHMFCTSRVVSVSTEEQPLWLQGRGYVETDRNILQAPPDRPSPV